MSGGGEKPAQGLLPINVGIEPPSTWRVVIYAKDQPDLYDPLPAVVSPDGMVVSRWQPTAEQRRLIAAGADLFLSVYTWNTPLQPVLLTVGPPEALYQ